MGHLLEGKVVLVTGAGSGIGAAAAVAYATNGATVIISDTESSNTIHRIKSKKRNAYFIRTDLSNASDCARSMNEVLQRHGRLDIAFNSVGISCENIDPNDMSAERFSRVISTNLCAIFYWMKCEIQTMVKQGGGMIINSPIVLGFEKADSFIGYIAARHGIIGFTQNAALKYADKNIKIHCVAPEFVNATLLETIDVKARTASSLTQLIGQPDKAEEIAAMVIWLSSGKAASVTSYYPGEVGYLSN